MWEGSWEEDDGMVAEEVRAPSMIGGMWTAEILHLCVFVTFGESDT